MSHRSRSAGPVLAGLLLLIDGIGALLLSGVLVFMSVFSPVAAIEGRDSFSQSQIVPALGVLAFAIACFWAARRAVRGVRALRIVGVALAGAILYLLASIALTASAMEVWEVALFGAVLIAQLVIIVALVRWPPEGSPPPAPTASASSAERP